MFIKYKSMMKIMDCLEKLGTEYCPNCVIIKEKLKELEMREAVIAKREQELDHEVSYLRISKLKKFGR